MKEILIKFVDFLLFFLLNPINFGKLRQLFQRNLSYLLSFFMLNLIYCFFSSVCVFYDFTVSGFSINMGTSVQVVQLVSPILITFFLCCNFINRKSLNLRLKFLSHFDEPQENSGKMKILFYLMILILVRACKFYVGKIIVHAVYAASSMLPELIMSLSDFVFAYHVDNLTFEMKNLNKSLKLKQMNMKLVNDVQKNLLKFDKLSKTICKVHSPRILLTSTFNFIQFVISFYWIFIRITFDHMEDFSTFLYIIQPLLCFYAVFNSTQKCYKEVRT